MLTSRGRRTLVVAVLVAILGRIFGIPELFGLAAAAVVVVIAAAVKVKVQRGGIVISVRCVPPVVNAGEPAVLEIVVAESTTSGAPSGEVVLAPDGDSRSAAPRTPTVVVPSLGAGSNARVELRLPTERRGVVEAGAYEASSGDWLGLARRHLASTSAVRCVVLPSVEPLASVLPRGLGWWGSAASMHSAERLASGTSSLRQYVPGDDLRRVHWRTTARVGELMVRDGGDQDDPDRIAATVVLEAGDSATPRDELERAVEVAASIVTAAAEERSSGFTGRFRLVTTTGYDSGTQHGPDALQEALVGLAELGPATGPSAERLEHTLRSLDRPDYDEVLLIVAASSAGVPDDALVSGVARGYSAAVVVAVGVDGVDDGDGYMVLPLPLGRPLDLAWSLESEALARLDEVSAGSLGSAATGSPWSASPGSPGSADAVASANAATAVDATRRDSAVTR